MSNDLLNIAKLFEHFLMMRPALFVAPTTFDELSHFDEKFGGSPIFVLRKLINIFLQELGISVILFCIPLHDFLPIGVMILAEQEVWVLNFLTGSQFGLGDFIHLFYYMARPNSPFKIRNIKT